MTSETKSFLEKVVIVNLCYNHGADTLLGTMDALLSEQATPSVITSKR